jgi:hypothetical protein
MLARLRRLFERNAARTPAQAEYAPAGSGVVEIDGSSLDLADGARWHEDIPHPDWSSVRAWVDGLPPERRSAAWLASERAWLDWLRGAIGLDYRLHESATALLLTTQDDRMARVKLDYLATTLRRIERVLEDIVDADSLGKEILIAFHDEDDYYRYVSGFYPEEGEFAMSSGMHINAGCSHFVTHGLDLDRIEPVIVHEMTHGCLAHLAIPAWLNEGLAVTVERVFAPRALDPYHQLELFNEHRRFWTPALIQEFWSGASYLRPDEANELSYDLGRILVDGLSKDDWGAFKHFVRDAQLADAGSAAAAQHLHLDLGEFMRLFLQRDDGVWAPSPATWPNAPERGAFRALPIDR